MFKIGILLLTKLINPVIEDSIEYHIYFTDGFDNDKINLDINGINVLKECNLESDPVIGFTGLEVKIFKARRYKRNCRKKIRIENSQTSILINNAKNLKFVFLFEIIDLFIFQIQQKDI